MKHIHQWTIGIESLSLLHIGDSDSELLLDVDGRPFLPGTSSAGAFRAYIGNMFGSTIETRLFGRSGKNSQSSRLIISDGVCEVDQPFHLHTGIRMDKESRTVVDKALYNRVSISPGAVFTLTLTLRSTAEEHMEDMQVLEDALAALNHGVIRLGAHKSTGSGKFLIRQGSYIYYNCTQEADVHAFVNQSKQAQEWKPKQEYAQPSIVKINIKGETETPLLIAGQYPNKSEEPDRTYMKMKYKGIFRPMIPGTSFKGVLRYGVERVLHFVQLKNKTSYLTRLFGSEQEGGQKQTGRLLLEDIFLEQDKTKTYYRIGVNPLTGGVKDGALLNEETVQGKFETSILYHLEAEQTENLGKQPSISSLDKISLGLLLLALKDLAQKRLNIGSGFSIGYGYVNIESIEVVSKDCKICLDFKEREITDTANWLGELHKELQLVKEDGIS